ncbi:hypothetical protein AVEN_173230-1 [Araneus ventricosus]|uniref:DUF7869 domain-containing protein n=1 Tax=Araneus ventricosus TaxID=182803 RepID=A0A4Y2TE81_ARAVE|nr:hypothetical protein AVEN_173230-1 [Araneus ventricosus]
MTMLQEWHARWGSSLNSRFLYGNFPEVNTKRCQADFLINQILTTRGCFPVTSTDFFGKSPDCECGRNQGTVSHYVYGCQIYREVRQNHPRSDTCGPCEKGDVDEIHVANCHQAFETPKFDRELPKLKNEVAYLEVDLQQTMPLPKLSVSKAFYLRQMWFYNFGVHIVTESQYVPHFFTWTEDVASRGSNEVASSFLTLLKFNETLMSKDHLIIWSDSCSGQNKNSTTLFLYQYLVFKGYLKVIEHKFPEVVHWYLDRDRDFGRIEKNLGKHEAIFLPEQYREIIMQSGRNHHVTDMTLHF